MLVRTLEFNVVFKFVISLFSDLDEKVAAAAEAAAEAEAASKREAAVPHFSFDPEQASAYFFCIMSLSPR
jgi:hypothetical protein